MVSNFGEVIHPREKPWPCTAIELFGVLFATSVTINSLKYCGSFLVNPGHFFNTELELSQPPEKFSSNRGTIEFTLKDL